MKYIITNEEFYVKRDHARNKYVRDNRKSEATQFTSKQAKHILGLKHKYTWMKDGFHAREIELGKVGKPMESSEIMRKGNGNCFMDWECDNTLIDNIETEERAIVGLLAYDSDQLGEKISLLIVDDNPKVLRLLERNFSKRDIKVTCVMNFKEATEKLKTDRFDALAVEQFIDGNSAVDFCMSVKGRYNGMLRLIMANQVDRELAEAKEKNIIDNYMIKPVSDLDILNEMR